VETLPCVAAHPFGQMMLHLNFVPPKSRRLVELWNHTQPGVRYLVRAPENTLDLSDFVRHLEGFTTIHTLAHHHDVIFRYKDRALISISWIPPWALPLHRIVKLLQLDASFEASRPFAYNVPQGILDNEAVPLALVVNVSDDVNTYQWFLDDLRSSMPNPTEFLWMKAILSDQSGAFNGFCLLNHLVHYRCHHHLIELWGAKPPLGVLVTHALQKRSTRSYRERRSQYLEDVKTLRDAGLATEEVYQKFCQFLSFDFPHGMWHRMYFGGLFM
jgi:hypothetical protein